ncbi:MAG: ECF-type sigma factor [Gemmatimonadota bacterium]
MPTSPESSTPADFEDGYQELRALAGAYVRRFSDSDSLQATALVHEVYLKLAKGSARFADRAHFIRTAAKAMRHILVDHARARQRVKHGGELSRITLGGFDIADPATTTGELDVLMLDDALVRLAEWDARQAQIVELRFFVGLTVEEAAEVLSISEKTVKRDWAMARAWLQRELGPAA